MTKKMLLLISTLILILPNEGASEIRLPSEITTEDWLLAFVDVETTGLQPGYHEMIDIGMIVTDLNGLPIDQLFLRIMLEHLVQCVPGARA